MSISQLQIKISERFVFYKNILNVHAALKNVYYINQLDTQNDNNKKFVIYKNKRAPPRNYRAYYVAETFGEFVSYRLMMKLN